MKNDLLKQPFSCAAASHKGNHKQYNEDAYNFCSESQIWVVADGMGGYEGGEVASQIAVEQIVCKVKEKINLVDAIQLAHEDICKTAKTPQGKVNMGATIVATQIIGDEFKVAWVGDSRAYLFRNQQLQLLSKDHTLVQEFLDSGEINKEQAKIHPQRNIIKQALGGSSINPSEVKGIIGDGMLLLCTDGLNDELSDTKIKTILMQDSSLQSKANALINTVLSLAGFDNITVLLVQGNDK